MYQEIIWLYKPQQQALAFENYDARTSLHCQAEPLASNLTNPSIKEFYSIVTQK